MSCSSTTNSVDESGPIRIVSFNFEPATPRPEREKTVTKGGAKLAQGDSF